MTVRILTGDCRDVLRLLPDASVHCVVTSPPYFGLRDYGVDGQIGLEPSPREFVDCMVAVFREVRRVLRDDGTLWLNLGDSYASAGGSGFQGKNGERADRRFTQESLRHCVRDVGMKPKDLMGIPWRVAFALQDDGWYLRQDIIWHKPNPMPESVRDRCTKSHEYLFLLSKSPRYYFDAEAIAEPRSTSDDAQVAGWASGDAPHNAIAHARDKGDARTFRGGQYTNGRKFDNSTPTVRDSKGNKPPARETRNRRSVWTVATEPFKEAHFATYPSALVEPCILAGCPADGIVLDPFGGAGTTGLVADRLMRSAILIELNPAYAEIARRRIEGDAPLLAKVGT